MAALRVYLGAAPGVGKTFKMLDEGHRRLARGTDVVVGFVETHGRVHTEARLEGLEVVPRRFADRGGASFSELDVDAVLARRPDVALVDELAHTNVDGREKRWQDVQVLLDAGIDVITTVNVQHLESLNDVVREITGVPQRETVPDAVVRAAQQIELVDMTPEALRRRMAHGNVYAPEKIDAALANYFRTGNLTALRELALLWLADKVDDELERYRAAHGIGAVWEARERVVVALTGGPEGGTLIRRAFRIAGRTKGADLMAVHVTRSDGLSGGSPAHLARDRELVETFGGTYHQVIGTDITTALLDFARGVSATQLVLGASRRGRLAQVFSPGVGVGTTAGSGPIDVHLVTHEQVRTSRSPRPGPALSRRRRAAGFALAVLGMPLLTLFLSLLRPDITLPTDILAFLVLVVGVALVGGLWPALVGAVGGFLLLNWYFTAPTGRFTVAQGENVLALLAFLVVATAVATVVDLAARRTREASAARAEAASLFTLAGSVLRGTRPLPALLAQLKESFALDAVTVLERWEDLWRVVASVGEQPVLDPRDADARVELGDGVVLVVRAPEVASTRGAAGRGAADGGGADGGRAAGGGAAGAGRRVLDAADRRVLEAFGAQAAVALRQERLAEQASAVGQMEEVDRLRTALLSAVSHDLRTPLASATAAVSSLRSPDVHFSAQDRAELLATAGESLETLAALVENLLDLSRLQAGALALSLEAMSVGEVVPLAVDELGDAARDVRIDVPDDVPDVVADPALVQRAVVNVLSNALRYSPAGSAPLVSASAHAGMVEVRVVDHGPGVAVEDFDAIFAPFQRLGDRDTSTGVGLGLALSRGLVEAMGGTLTPEPTPGGGLTMVIALPEAPS